MFIEVKKISTTVKKAKDGSDVKNPLTKERVIDNSYVIHTETIRIDEIRSIRKWNKDVEQEAYIDGDVTKIYLKGDGKRDFLPDMLINESYDSFTNRLNASKAP